MNKLGKAIFKPYSRPINVGVILYYCIFVIGWVFLLLSNINIKEIPLLYYPVVTLTIYAIAHLLFFVFYHFLGAVAFIIDMATFSNDGNLIQRRKLKRYAKTLKKFGSWEKYKEIAGPFCRDL